MAGSARHQLDIEALRDVAAQCAGASEASHEPSGTRDAPLSRSAIL
jgi:hypothetical protein